MKPRNFIAAGVGGQGTLVASDIIAEVGLLAGQDVKKSEVHGMAQRGGAVVSHVRWAPAVASPLCEKGTVDFLVALEQLEALRWLGYLKPGGAVIYNHQQIPPASTVFGDDQYPDPDTVRRALEAVAGQVWAVEGTRIAQELGNLRVMNVVMLGALAHLVDDVDEDLWKQGVTGRVPEKARDLNLQAFAAGTQQISEAITNIKG